MDTDRIYEQFKERFGEPAARALAETLGNMFEELHDTATKEDFRILRESIDADVIASGVVNGEQTDLVVEVSWTGDIDDIVRADERAKLLRRAGLPAIPLVACNAIPPESTAFANLHDVRIWLNGSLVEAAAETGIQSCLRRGRAALPIMPQRRRIIPAVLVFAAGWAFTIPCLAQTPPYDVRPAVAAPFWRVRFEAAQEPGGLIFPVTVTAWIPPGVKTLRGVIVHQHGCGEGSCTSGLSGAWDLHWQALARRHDCGLVAPAYEQPKGGDCQMWCDPRNGSAAAVKTALAELGRLSGHPEFARVPWALWGHSGGGHWAGGMVMLEPERVVAAWLRSGAPLLEADPNRAGIKPHSLPEAALAVPLMCNRGTKEGVTATDNKFAGVWPANQAFFKMIRSRGGLVGVAIDPLTSRECGNSRYLAIHWLDANLAARLPAKPGEPLAAMPADEAWLAPITGGDVVPAKGFESDPLTLGWLPNERLAAAWMQYVKDTAVTDTTPPPAPTALRLAGRTLTWEAGADLESGLAGFVIERNAARIATHPEKQRNPFGRPLFQGLLYSDTPPQPLAEMRHELSAEQAADPAVYRVYSDKLI